MHANKCLETKSGAKGVLKLPDPPDFWQKAF